jgi:hypothetical protein
VHVRSTADAGHLCRLIHCRASSTGTRTPREHASVVWSHKMDTTGRSAKGVAVTDARDAGLPDTVSTRELHALAATMRAGMSTTARCWSGCVAEPDRCAPSQSPHWYTRPPSGKHKRSTVAHHQYTRTHTLTQATHREMRTSDSDAVIAGSRNGDDAVIAAKALHYGMRHRINVRVILQTHACTHSRAQTDRNANRRRSASGISATNPEAPIGR